MSIEYAYDRNGNLTREDNEGMTFTYDLLSHPLTIAGLDNQTDYVYSADGRKFCATHIQYTFKNGALDVCHYFIQDYQGNNRILIGSNGQRDQYSHFYPYGGLMGDISTNDAHSYKYGGKELDRDFGIDLLSEKYYGISPYAYCVGDPVNLVDPTGKFGDKQSFAVSVVFGFVGNRISKYVKKYIPKSQSLSENCFVELHNTIILDVLQKATDYKLNDNSQDKK